MDRLFIGIDSGTQGTKCVVLSETSKKILAESYRSYSLIENHMGGREQDPAHWLTACSQVLKEVLAHPAVDTKLIKAIGVSGQQHGMVPLDKAGNVIRMAKLWCDTETVSQCDTLTQDIGGSKQVISEIGNQIAAGFTASKILWLKENEPENYDKLDNILLPHDYINYWLTGEKKCECGDASGTAYFDVVNRRWSDIVLNAIDPSGKLQSCLPKLIDSDEIHGTLRHELAQELGLSSEVIISSGGGDNMMAAIGTGNVAPDVITASLGTSGTIYGYSDTPVVDSEGELAAFCSSTGGWLPLICTMNVTVATELMRQMYGFSLEEMNKRAEQTAPGAAGLMLLPYFNGERTPSLPEAKATMTGMTSTNMTPDFFCRAAMEGAVFGLRYGLDVLKRNGLTPEEIRITGGGAKSRLWRQIVADVFDCEVVSLVSEEAGAAGAALQAMWCYHSQERDIPLHTITEPFVQLDESSRITPSIDNKTLYEDIYHKYLDLNSRLATF